MLVHCVHSLPIAVIFPQMMLRISHSLIPGRRALIPSSRAASVMAFAILRQNADIWRLPVSRESGKPRGPPEALIATTREDSRGAWSPDLTRIAFNSDRGGQMNIWLYELADALYEPTEDPAAVTRTEAPYTFEKHNSHYEVRLNLPFAAKGEVGLFKKGDELVVEVGTLRRHIGLPTSMAGLTPTRATLEHKMLTVEMKEG